MEPIDPIYCAFCEEEAIARIDRTGTPICSNCMDVYEAGQSNPDGGITLLENECDEI